MKEIIEEAAGVKRAKIEKEDSEKKLQDLKNEIEKIDYVEKDLKLRVDYLKKEQEKARLFKDYTKKIDLQRFMVCAPGLLSAVVSAWGYLHGCPCLCHGPRSLRILKNLRNLRNHGLGVGSALGVGLVGMPALVS